ncbi:hypothetical protein [Candidatus Sodalis sp. SoCistrobi]|uniref:hypothetical protein n=1 Tax=Candidatus Sodalis sp. SoCistrobi TaxID=1922216 RepID=UPI000F777212|nr:hypothetical protein [Candidatus Sodalis sp. SoCistrobi]
MCAVKATADKASGAVVQHMSQPERELFQMILSQSSTGSGFKAGASGLKTGVSGLENFNHFIIFQLYADF